MQLVGNWLQKMKNKNIANQLKSFFNDTPQICLILGSGLQDITKNIINKSYLSYDQIPNFHKTSIRGHKGEFIFGYIDNIPIICASGRFHYYEGYTFDQVGSLIEIFNEFNPKITIVTNSSGCLNINWKLGSFMLINKFIDFSFINSSKIKLYEVEKVKDYNKIFNIAIKNNIQLYEGTYTFTTGPSYETDAEILEIIDNGGNAVGMSTFPEFLKCRKLKMNALFISCLTNYGAGLTDNKISHKDVLENADKAKKKFKKLIINIIESI